MKNQSKKNSENRKAKAKPKKNDVKKAAIRQRKTSSLSDLKSISLVKNILFKPDRYKYIKKQGAPKSQECVFCVSADSGQPDSLCVYKSKYSMIILNKFPYNSGHVLVLPQRHCGDLFKLSDDEYQDLMETVRLAGKAVMAIYAPSAFNMGMNHGAWSGAGIPEHLHFHVIPRWAGDLNFFPLIAQTKVVIETLEQTYTNYMSYFRSKV